MARKFALVGLAVTAVAFAGLLPATATASPRLFDGGSPLPLQATVDATSNNVRITNTFLGTQECESWIFRTEVQENNGVSALDVVGTAAETGNCQVGGEPFVVTEPTLLTLSSSGGDEGTLSLSFVFDYSAFECPYEGEGRFTYATGTDVLKIPGLELQSSFEFCEPENGKEVFEGDFTLSTENGTPVTIPAEPAPPPGPSPQLTEGKVPLAKGEAFRVTSTNAYTTNTALGDLHCASLSFSQSVLKNSEGQVESAGKGGEAESCDASGEILTVTNQALELLTAGGDAGEMSVAFVADVGPFECPYEGDGTFVYPTGTDTLELTGFDLESEFEFCEPLVGAPKFEGDFTLETGDGTPITIPGEPVPPGPSPQMREGEVPLEAGATITATSSNAVTTNTALGKIECTTVSISAELLKNEEKEIKAKGTSGEAKSCKGTAGAETFPLTITEPTLVSLVTTGKDTGTLELKFLVDLGPFSCLFEGEGAFSYTTGTDVLNVAGIQLETAEICEPKEGIPTFEGDFTITTKDGTPVKIPAPSTPSPVLEEGSSVLAEGGSIRATSTNPVTTRTALGRLECKELSFTTDVDRNSEGEISLSTTGSATKTCQAEGEPLTLTNASMDLFTDGGDSAEISVSFAADVGAFECPFEGEGSVPYTTGTDVLKIAGIVLKTPVEICEPLVGKPGFEGDFTLTTANGTQVKVS